MVLSDILSIHVMKYCIELDIGITFKGFFSLGSYYLIDCLANISIDGTCRLFLQLSDIDSYFITKVLLNLNAPTTRHFVLFYFF